DELYSALGTTIKKAGSQEKQYTIDFSYQYEVAKAAAENGVRKYALVSSAGADSESRVFYSKMKGELDDAVKKLDFDTCVVLRPSILEGEREESRLGETIGMILANIFTKIPGLRKYRPIPGEIVARGAINALRKSAPGYHIFELDEIFEL
ncbi:MAG: NADH-quinone oxidoreductase subunit F, partial [Balneolaceae bacterium]